MNLLRRAVFGAISLAPLTLFPISEREAFAAKPVATLKTGDRVVLIGNGLAERMQHDGWLETVFQQRLPQRRLSFRNLAFAGDKLLTWHRSAGFGSREEWLERTQADVIFAMFGYNESFAGKAGLAQFKADLATFLAQTQGRKFNGKTAARLVLFSPIAFENLNTPNIPDGKSHNARLALYTQAMAEVAKDRNVPFVDLFRLSQRAFAAAKSPLTINGVHLTAAGNRAVAQIVDRAFFPGKPPLELLKTAVERLRAAVKDKNFHWYHRYRTTDGYNVYGGRSHLKYPDKTTGRKVSNREVCQREMEILDVMTANRDRRVWAVAQGRELKVKDDNTPPFIPITTNKPGPLPGGKWPFQSGKKAIESITTGRNIRVNLFASEEQFPELINPVQMAFDTKGRLWVAVWPSYPHWKPKEKLDDKLLILEDTDGDGKADICKTFAGGLHCPAGFEFWGGGVIVVSGPSLLFLKDTDGDDKADTRTRILHGFDTADSHHTANSFVLTPGGSLLFGEGVFHMSQFETVRRGALRNANAAFWRFNPRTYELDRYIPANFANPHGNVIDRWGQNFVHDGTGAQPYHATLFSGHLDSPLKHPGPPQLYRQRTRPCPGTEILSSGHFPQAMQGNLIVGNVIGFQGLLRYKLVDDGASFQGIEQEPILRSSDGNFRPTDIEIGPRGEIFMTEWQNPIIGHMQHHLRDPNRDRKHGRVYRITYAGRPLLKPVKIAGESIAKLLEALKNPNDRVRYRARIELSGRETKNVIAAARKWVEALKTTDDPDLEHHLLEALWLHQQHNVMHGGLLRRVLSSPDFRARAAGAKVAGEMRHRIPEAIRLLKKLADDKHPRVRLEAVRACSFFSDATAAEAALTALNHPTDRYIDFVLKETMRQLDRYWRTAVRQGKPFAAENPAGMNYVLVRVATPDLLKLPKTQPVYIAILTRPGIDHKRRMTALTGLAKLKNTDEVAVLLENIIALDKAPGPRPGGASTTVMYDLAHLLSMRPGSELKKYRDALLKLATSANRPMTRQVGYVATIGADESVDAAWNHAVKSIDSLRDLLEAVPIIPDPKLRASLYGRVQSLLHGLPPALAQQKSKDNSVGTIRRAAMNAVTYIPGHEAEVFQTLSKLLRKPVGRVHRDMHHAAVQAISRIPKRHWPQSEVRPLVYSIVAFAKSVPATDRALPAVLDALQLGNDLATLLPPKERMAVQAAIGDLGVRIIRIRPVPHKMMYDRRVIAVQAGKPVQIVFENIDIMPHNLLIVKPGSMREIGEAGERMATQPDAFARGFVPDSPKVLFASRLLQSRETERLTFVAPKSPGVYPYVCTFPGHWRRMRGVMHVVSDLEKHLAENPLPEATPTLDARPFVQDWKYDDLVGSLGELKTGRSFTGGKNLFKVAACITCHKMEKEGGLVGPDLSKWDPKMKPADLLREMTDPSKVIQEKYRTWVIVDAKGKQYTGMILKQDKKSITLQESPLGKENPKPIVIAVGDIEFKRPLKTSMMPDGLLKTLKREEILDLLAYLLARGKPGDARFRKN